MVVKFAGLVKLQVTSLNYQITKVKDFFYPLSLLSLCLPLMMTFGLYSSTVGIGVLVMGLGSIVFAFPQFTFDDEIVVVL